MTLGSVYRWLLWGVAVLLVVAALGAFGQGLVAAGFLLLLLALIAAPPLWETLADRGLRIRPWVRWTGVFFVLVALGSQLPLPADENSRTAQSGDPSGVGSGAAAQHGFTPDVRGVALAKLLLLDDFSSYLAGKKVVGDWGGVQHIDVRVTGRELSKAYNENEAAADERFKGKTVAITGVIERIGKDITGSAYLLLEGGGFLSDVQAYPADETLAVVDQYRRGDLVLLICQGDGMALTFPMLKDCQANDVLVRVKKSQIEDMASNVLSGSGSDTPDKLKIMAGIGYVLGEALPKGNACETANPNDMVACGHAMHGISKPTLHVSYDALAKQLGLPPRPNG